MVHTVGPHSDTSRTWPGTPNCFLRELKNKRFATWTPNMIHPARSCFVMKTLELYYGKACRPQAHVLVVASALHNSEEPFGSTADSVSLLLRSLPWLCSYRIETKLRCVTLRPSVARSLPASRLFSGHIDSSVKPYTSHSLAILQPEMLFHWYRLFPWMRMPFPPTLDCHGEVFFLLYVPT